MSRGYFNNLFEVQSSAANCLERIDRNLDRIANSLEILTESRQQDISLCGDDDPTMREKSSPCILEKGHDVNIIEDGIFIRGGHKDSKGGRW